MEYLIIEIGIIIFIISAFIFIVSYKKSELHLSYLKLLEKCKVLKEEYNKETELLKDLNKTQEKLAEDISKAANEREVAMQRAREAQAATDRLLQSEQGRARAELQRMKELQEVKIEKDIETKRVQLELLYEKREKELLDDYMTKMDQFDAELLQKQSQLNEFRAISDSVNKAILRNKELKEKSDFYSIQISDNDKDDIKVLQSMDLRLHNRDVIPKLIWELFIRRPAQEMIKRVVGARKIGGVYKITNKETGESYIGKTTDFSTRWQNHLKTAIGLEGAARTTLHNRLASDGLWNYTFEILEEVDKERQSEREAFYIDLYGTKQQLNMKTGDKNGTQ